MSKKIYLEDLEEMLERMHEGVYYSIVDVFKDYFPLDDISSYQDEEDEDIEENSSNC